MKVIHKGTIDKFEYTQGIGLPKGGKIIAIGNQHEKVVFWYECEAEAAEGPMSQVVFITINTGDKVPDNCEFIGTVILHGGVYVRHVYVSKN